MLFYSFTISFILSPLNVMNRFTLEQQLGFIWNLFPKQKQIDREFHENVVQNLVTENDQQCPIYGSLLVKFVKLISLLMLYDTVRAPENIEAETKSVRQLLIVLKNWDGPKRNCPMMSTLAKKKHHLFGWSSFPSLWVR